MQRWKEGEYWSINNAKLTIKWNNGETIILNFAWESYNDVNEIIELQTNLNEKVVEDIGKINEAFDVLNLNQDVEQKTYIIDGIKWYIDNISAIVGNKTYVVEWMSLAEYCENIQQKVDAYVNNKGITKEDIITDIDKISDVWYFPSTFNKIKN